MTCIGAIAGLPAIVLGATARREIDRSNGSLAGRGIAAFGIVSGLFGTGFGVVVLLWLTGAIVAPDATDTGNAQASTSSVVVASAEPSTSTSNTTPPSFHTKTYGSLEVIDLDESRTLTSQLTEIVERGAGRTIILQTVTRSASCDAVAASLPDKRMQHALANVTLVRVNVDEYSTELTTMKVETRSAPWFYKLDATGIPTDAISGEAWASVPEMAPVLGKFVHRAHP